MDKLAEEEEEEALALQKHMDATFEEQDFDATDFEVCSRQFSYDYFVFGTWIKGFVWEYTDFSFLSTLM